MISLLCPSRGRPENLLAMAESAAKTATNAEQVELCVYIDDDDPQRYNYEMLVADSPLDNTLEIGPRTTLSECWNKAAKASSGEILMLAADDLRFRTHNWDVVVETVFNDYPDHIALVYGSDGVANERMATHPFIHRKWMETTGYFVPGIFVGDHCDLWLDEVARSIGRNVYVDALYIEHLHPSVDKAPLDRTHVERIERMKQDNPYQIYLETQEDRVRDAEKLRAVMQ